MLSKDCDNTWFDVAAWEGKGMPDLTRIQKGSPVQVFGRIRMRSYTTAAGVERLEPEVRASRVVLLDPEIKLSPSM
ncbi:MAG: single-stranded DNA-binding protein [Bacteroidales bacterium]|nr:single-stranded DNA-binding protein [Bacteroidales bacterium]